MLIMNDNNGRWIMYDKYEMVYMWYKKEIDEENVHGQP